MEDNKNQKPLFGIIGGSSFLKSEYFANLAKINVETEHGTIILYKGENFVFCQRHGSTLTPYNPPHLIPNLAIAAAFSKLGVKQIIGFASVGSMKMISSTSGTLLVALLIHLLLTSLTLLHLLTRSSEHKLLIS
eukprot:TRINITY_DN8236_c0_g1_i1.p1 TRINITY_DN8236_c0_g1~~TRINITY_DN8236_c0_g1_i1.p1  ORF type:complete len:134 (+),score=26.78 TRINITY_DN8236_c0_g1_i1:60-461(+)